MFIPLRRTGELFKVEGKDVYGDRRYSANSTNFGWAPVHLRDNLQDSSVRADSSASRGRADERVADVRILVEKFITPEKGDKIVLDGEPPLEVIRVQKRIDIRGQLHHWEVDCGTS